MLLIVGLVLLFLLPSPWNFVAFAVCLALFLGELLAWNRTVRRRGEGTRDDNAAFGRRCL